MFFLVAEYLSYQDKEHNDAIVKPWPRRHRKRGQRKSIQNRSGMKESSLFLCNIVDDLWIDIFYFCNMKDFLSINKCCKHFNKLTNYKLYHRINLYWKYQSKITYYKDINDNDTCIDNNWCKFYKQLKILAKKSKLTLDDLDLPDLMINAIEFDLVSVVSFVFHKTCFVFKTNVKVCESKLRFDNFFFELSEFFGLWLMLRYSVSSDSIETFKCALSIMTQKIHNNKEHHYFRVFERQRNGYCILCFKDHVLINILDTLEEMKKIPSNDMEKYFNMQENCDFIKHTLLHLGTEQFIPLLAFCCYCGSVKIGE